MNLFQLGEFTLHSGRTSKFKIECDALTDDDVATIAHEAQVRLASFGAVEGVPRGGLRLAEALAPYAMSGPLLIVDDVLTSGGSMETHRAGRDAIGFVVFARGPCPTWVTPLFRMPEA